MIRLESLDYDEAARYLGYRDSKPEAGMLLIMKECEKKIIEACKGSYCYRVFDIEESCDDGISLCNTSLFLKGDSIKKHLSGCEKVIVLAATTGSDIDRLINVASVKDIAHNLVMDTMASVAIEQICDIAMEEIKEKLSEYKMTWRFSPGYGDMPLSLQSDVLEAVDARKRIGLGITNGDMLTPVKSVTAIIGLFDYNIEKLEEKPACGKKSTCEKCPRHEVCNLSPLKIM